MPYDCGLFFSRTTRLYELCGPGANAPAYLKPASATATASSEDSLTPNLDAYRSLPSPLFMNLENSRRFRALPVFASLVSLGRSGYAALFERNIEFARTVAAFLRSHQAYDVLLPRVEEAPAFRQMNIVCFAPSARAPSRFTGKDGAAALIRAINGTRRVYVTGTTWRGRGAVRLAVSNWQTELERDWPVVRQVLNEVMQ